VALPLLSFGYLIKFALYGHHILDLEMANGFFLLAYGMYKDNRIDGLLGAVLALGAFAAKYLL